MGSPGRPATAFDNIDKDLLRAARAAAEHLAELERQADMARADYHHAVRRLHLAGAPLREVATALGMSHQRVQQIVQAGGGTWWSRVWHRRKVRSDMTCSFCGLPPGQVAKLIAGPRAYICDSCVAAGERVWHGAPPEPSGVRAPMALVPPASRVRCSFCAQKPRSDLAIVTGRGHYVCQSCLVLCRRILDDRTQAQPATAAGGA